MHLDWEAHWLGGGPGGEEGKVHQITNDGSNQHSRHVKHGAYDGLHMYSQAGAEAFTTSLINRNANRTTIEYLVRGG